jgi:hypothetical protein
MAYGWLQIVSFCCDWRCLAPRPMRMKHCYIFDDTIWMLLSRDTGQEAATMTKPPQWGQEITG